MTRIRCFSMAVFVLLLTCPPADAQWFIGSFWHNGSQVSEITVTPDSTFSVELRVQLVEAGPAICGYCLAFYPTSPQLAFLGWSDAHNWDVDVSYPDIYGYSDSGEFPPPGLSFSLGTATFQAPATAGSYMLGLQAGASIMLDCSTFQSIGGDPALLAVIVGGPPLSEPGIPPVPSGYAMGNVVNGDFEAYGGSLAGWISDAFFPSRVGVYAPDAGEHTARLHAEGGIDPWSSMYMSGSATLEQAVFIPLDATALSFTYATRTTANLPGTPAATITIGESTQTLADAPEWTRQIIELPSSVKGQRTLIRFTASDNGWGWSEPLTNTMRLYLDYISVDGTAILQTTTWSAPGGGSWEEPGNWNPAGVPDNSATVLHDVVIPPTASSGAITLDSPRTVFALRNDRYAQAFHVQTGGTLNILEDCLFTGVTLQIAAGAAVNIGRSMTLDRGAIEIHPDGNPVGAQALNIGGGLTLYQDPWAGSDPVSVTVRDGVLQAGYLSLKAANVAVVNSPEFSGTSQVNVVGSTHLHAEIGGTSAILTLNPGTALVTDLLYLDSRTGANSVKVQSATIAGQDASSSIICYGGTLQFRGQNCLVSQISLKNSLSSQVLFTDAGVTFSKDVYSRSTMRLVNSSVTFESEFDAGGGTLTADATSTLIFQKTFSTRIADPAAFDLQAATLKYAGANTNQLDVPGLDLGALATGFDSNFSIGTLVVDSGTLQLRQSDTGHALYVRNLVIKPDAALDLNGVKLYWLDSFTDEGGTVTGGQARKALPRPQGLPSPSLGTGYTATAEVCGDINTVTGGPAQVVHDWHVSNVPGSSQVQAAAGAGYCTVSVNLSRSYTTNASFRASASLNGPLSLPLSSQYPLMTPTNLVVHAMMTGGGDELSWSAKVFRDQEVLTTLGPGQREARMAVWAGEPGLRLEVAMSDGSTWGSFSDRLQILIYALPRPPADLNGDGLVDAQDLDAYADCATGPAVAFAPASPGACQLTADADGIIPADLDRDRDVDQADFGLLQQCYNGPNAWVDTHCEH